jgi:hypothetical protein
MLALAKLRLTTGDVDGCQQMCVGILRAHVDNEEVAPAGWRSPRHRAHCDSRDEGSKCVG